ncbi:MAG TPA: response regulator [Caulobacteraceae bacterium]|nr:response regulator [Caulobacteraceae bacterium]
MRIVVADDDLVCRDVVCQALEQAGYRVETASDGNGALRALEREPADVLVLDLLMPNKDGIEVLLETRDRWPGLKIVVMSGGSTRSGAGVMLKTASVLGADRVCEKAAGAGAILDAVRDVAA